VARDKTLHRETAVGAKREGHGGLAGRLIVGRLQTRSQGVKGVSGGMVVVQWLFASLSVLLLAGLSTTMRHISILCLGLSEDLLLRLKPVIKGALTDASFVVFVGSCGDPFMEISRHGRCV